MQGQHVGLASDSLNTGNEGNTPWFPFKQGQHFIYGLQFGFSQTSSHFGLAHSGFLHSQSQLGSSQTASHSGLGA